MHPHLIIASIAFASFATAQIEEGDFSPMTPKEEILEELLSERDSKEALEKAETKAKELGVSEQAILEARFLFHVDRAEDAEIAAMLPRFLERKKNFVLGESEIFASVDDWLAVVEYVHAMAAMQRGDKDAFKKHITEAFWLSPQQGAVFAPHIDRVRLADAMKDLEVDLSRKHPGIFEEADVSLGEVLGERKALLVYFWSPYSQECEITLLEFLLSASHFVEKGVAVVCVLPETSGKVRLDAKKMLVDTEKKLPGVWVVDSLQNPLSAQLHVKTVPVMVLLSREGRVLFNGHPSDEKLWKSLASVNPEIERPELTEE